METLTTLHKALKEDMIRVPRYQRAYSWDSPSKTVKQAQVAVFLDDILEQINSNSQSPFYLGHFLFEKDDTGYKVIDGQQRLTTVTILLSAIFASLERQRDLTEREKMIYEDTLRRGSHIYRFSTVDYDNQFFRDYVIDRTRSDSSNLPTVSAIRIATAFDYYVTALKDYDELRLIRLLDGILEANCTTHTIKDEAEAIQMFIFQNNRGKPPTNLEIIKAQFMHHAHLYGGDDASSIIAVIRTRFEKIYRSISAIERAINEDDILTYTLKVHFNSIWADDALERIPKELVRDDSMEFVLSFSQSLEQSFEKLSLFYEKHEKTIFDVHSIITLGGIGIALPFIIKAYRFGIEEEALSNLCKSLETLVLRHRLIGTRASIESRIRDVFEGFTKENNDIQPILDRIQLLKNTQDWWWAYWNDENLERSILGGISHPAARHLLWKYENHLRSLGKAGYEPHRYETILRPELEHIAPSTEPGIVAHGYGDYDEEFRQKYLDCLGNYLLVSKSHNCSIGNQPFERKLEDYKYLLQQSEVESYTEDSRIWNKSAIERRNTRIRNFILENC
jgi:hypothetical protein